MIAAACIIIALLVVAVIALNDSEYVGPEEGLAVARALHAIEQDKREAEYEPKRLTERDQ